MRPSSHYDRLVARPALVERAGPADAAIVTTGRGGGRLALATLAAITVGVWLAVLRLAVAFRSNELDWRYVAEQSRSDAPWYYRLAGVWGGMDGSLLLFAGILGGVALLAVRRSGPTARWCAVATVGAMALIDVILTSPFGRLDAPAVRGFGLTPILEHPAMTAHPPILYSGVAAAFGAFLVGIDRRSPWRAARPWLLATIGLLTLAMALGAVWSYMEQGWGGYWAWDPVENTSLVVWLAAIVALHGMPLMDTSSISTAYVLAPWVLGIAGIR
jgi:cytochrome c-type biogenesis protein CcmF